MASGQRWTCESCEHYDDGYCCIWMKYKDEDDYCKKWSDAYDKGGNDGKD